MYLSISISVIPLDTSFTKIYIYVRIYVCIMYLCNCPDIICTQIDDYIYTYTYLYVISICKDVRM